MAKIELSKLSFSLPNIDTSRLEKEISDNSKRLKILGNSVGQNNAKFDAALSKLGNAVASFQAIESLLVSPIFVRAYAVTLPEKLQNSRARNLYMSNAVLDAISRVRDKPSGLVVESLITQYFKLYDELNNYRDLANWLLTAKSKRKDLDENVKFLLSDNGPRAVAERCIEEQVDFSCLVESIGLAQYGLGRYLTVAQLHYYVNQLESLEPNETSDLLTEIMQPSAYNAPYSSVMLLGHRALEIIIDKVSGDEELSPQWEKFILSIAGDPRIPKDHQNYRKWWSVLGAGRASKVCSWLSKLDLKIFLDILEQYAKTKGGADMQRMYPPRKKFLEGLFDAKLVKGTRLYLSAQADQYAKQNYEENELPSYSIVRGNQASVISIKVGDIYLMEGSHSCKLWLYRNLSSNAVIHDYRIDQPEYYYLTQGMDFKNRNEGFSPAIAIVHQPAKWRWQRQAIEQLSDWGVNISPTDVIQKSELMGYLRTYGF
ncbi:hypothetical protein FCV66_13565 [Enterovibrio norvegicus]|uniref:EH signature domain-containing protein n=1 Tax=Enterovibrio norvegicus TaxID=188144 RepID=UPI0010BE1E2E|nr:EH signature domain-containing protein [Enterovibrio norvegicus]TKF13393.1 hypothetical protein FCV66_13565 [Enterovibrio norvegicus]